MKYILSTAVVLFFIMDPLGDIPVFLSVLKQVSPERRKKVLARELFIALIFLLFFLFMGKYVLLVLHLTTEAINIGGGIVLLVIALKMIFPSRGGSQNIAGEPFIVPLAIPLISGPAVFAMILILNHDIPYYMLKNLSAIVLAWGVTSFILYNSTYCYKIFKEKGLIAIERLMGMILIIMSVQMFMDGISKFMLTTK